MENDKVLRIKEVTELSGLSSSTISRLEKQKLFPIRRRLGERSVGWLESEIIRWISTRHISVQRDQGSKK
jgi:prophage regulatory protein